MSFNRKILYFFVMLWVFIWTVFVVEWMFPEPGISPSVIYYLCVAPILIGLGIFWVRRG